MRENRGEQGRKQGMGRSKGRETESKVEASIVLGGMVMIRKTFL